MAENTVKVQASTKGLRLSPRKVSLVAALVRDRSVADALVILEHTPKRAAKPLAKLVASAKSNAVNNNRVVPESLVIKQISVVSGPRLRRYRPAAMGRALPYLKRSSHVYIEVEGAKKPEVKAKKAEDKKETK